MRGSDSDNQPLTYYHGRAVYLSLYMALALAVGMVLTGFLIIGRVDVDTLFAFWPFAFAKGFVWQPLTWVFVSAPTIMGAVSIFAFYAWGLEIEKFFGRTLFVRLCAALVAAPVAVVCLLAFLGWNIPLEGSFYITTGFLAAFATLYPQLDYFFGWITLRWFATLLIGIYVLMLSMRHAWVSVGLTLLSAALGHVFVRYERGEWTFNLRALWPKSKPRLRVLPRPAEARPARRAAATSAAPSSRSSGSSTSDDPEEEIDALLDKIARSGMSSLSASEKARLETLRQEMIRKGS